MNLNSNPENVEELANEIQEFIDNKREPDKIVKARVVEIRSSDNIVKLKLEENFNFYKGAFVVVNKISGTVQDKFSNILKISFKGNPNFQEGDMVSIDSSMMNLVIDRLEKTINRIQNDNLDDNGQKILQFILGKDEPLYHPKNIHFISENLNLNQKEAVKRTLSADNFHLIIGPPGTGKTYVITEIIKQLLKKKRKIMVTAWTNIAVDNILEKFQENSSENILRIGSFNEVSANCKKFTLEKRREKSSDWKEAKELERLIKKQYQAIHLLENEKYIVNNELTDLKTKRINYQKDIDSLMCTEEKYKLKCLKYEPSNFNVDEEIVNLNMRCKRINQESKNLSNLASGLLNIEEWEDSLEDEDLYYQIEGEIKKAHTQKIIKRISSPFRRKKYQLYLEDLQNKEKKFQKIKESYTPYREEKNRIGEEYFRIYDNYMGNPYEDCLKREIEHVNLSETYLPLKIESFQNEINTNHSIIYGSYQHYISSLKYDRDRILEEVALLNININFKIKKYDSILNDIKSLKELLEINNENLKRILTYIDNEILNKSDLFVATVISSAHPILKETFFEWTIMDEASQVASFISLIPLLKTKRFVLVGDDKQLQPIEESQLSHHLNLSIFNRLLNNFPNNATFLDTQYRMNEGLAKVASELFYNGNLKTFHGISNQTLDCSPNGYVHQIISPEVPFTYIDTHNLEYHEDEVGSGCENSKEAELVVKLVSMLQEEGISSNDIGVITPYRRHKNNIKNQLNNKAIKVDVDTVYRFQGREKDVIILTFCNSKLGRLRPFLRKFIERPSQVNVSLTRARKKLILVGNSKTLKESKLLENVIHLIGEENTVLLT